MNGTIRRVVIRGRVQGVGYRAWVEHQSTRLGLQGWVRNRRDGSVEALLKGTSDAVTNMIDSCRNGPPSARVDEVADEAVAEDALGLRRAGEPFSVLPTI